MIGCCDWKPCTLVCLVTADSARTRLESVNDVPLERTLFPSVSSLSTPPPSFPLPAPNAMADGRCPHPRGDPLEGSLLGREK